MAARGSCCLHGLEPCRKRRSRSSTTRRGQAEFETISEWRVTRPSSHFGESATSRQSGSPDPGAFIRINLTRCTEYGSAPRKIRRTILPGTESDGRARTAYKADIFQDSGTSARSPVPSHTGSTNAFWYRSSGKLACSSTITCRFGASRWQMPKMRSNIR